MWIVVDACGDVCVAVSSWLKVRSSATNCAVGKDDNPADRCRPHRRLPAGTVLSSEVKQELIRKELEIE